MYDPRPIETEDICLSPELLALTEQLAEQVHETWARARLDQGWRWGPVRDDREKTTPCLVPYSELPETERDYDRQTAMQTLRMIIKLGYRIVPEERKAE